MITLLGATGNVGGKTASLLVKKGQKVRLIARNENRLRSLVGPNVQAFAGDAADTNFLVKALKGSDAVFTLLPPNPKTERFMDYADKMIESICRAIEISGVRYVVNLSSLGAELPADTGPIVGLHRMEERLNSIKGLNVVHVRAAYFMENFLASRDMIISQGINGSALIGDKKIAMIATRDIAAVVADKLVNRDFIGSRIQEILGERDLSMIEATSIIAGKINRPGLTYVSFPYGDAELGMQSAGLSRDMSRLYVVMSRAFNEGRIVSAAKRSLQNTTPTSFEVFCDEVMVPALGLKKAA